MTQTIDESRAQLIADLQERAEELTELNRIAVALTSEFDLQRLLQMITDAARKVFPHSRSCRQEFSSSYHKGNI